jgi:hypothetical protein
VLHVPPKIRSRQINEHDLESVADLLTRGFKIRRREYWRGALAKLTTHPTPPGLPRYGYLLECSGAPVGVVLLIFSSIPKGATVSIRCNVSSWYVEPDFRNQAALLISHALRHKHVTYLNASPAMNTRPIIEAQGFARYSQGQFVAIPALSPKCQAPTVTVTRADRTPEAPFEAAERDLLLHHENYGCLSLWCTTPERAYPFVFMPRRVKGIIPCVQLVYCRDIVELARFARPIGRFLARSGRPFVIVDANGSIPGLVGKYFDGKLPKYFKGPDRPRFGDLAYTESVMFGL